MRGHTQTQGEADAAMSRKFSRLPWAKVFRRIPAHIETRLAEIGASHFLVGSSKVITEQDFSEKRYGHLNIETREDVATNETSILPSSTVGESSYYNATLEERPRKSGGKVWKWVFGRAPHGKSGAFHRTRYRRQVWPTDILVPDLTHIEFAKVGGGTNPPTIVARFRVMEVLHRDEPSFRMRLLRCLNLLQENVGKVDLFAVDATAADFVRRASEELDWKILPSGQRAGITSAVLKRIPSRRAESRKQVQERLDVILKLSPQHAVQASRGFAGYFAAQFTDNLTVFENLEADNALYVVRGPWQEISKLTRTQIRALYASKPERIIHSKGWDMRLARLVAEARGEVWDR
jgi:hypothetical protein